MSVCRVIVSGQVSESSETIFVVGNLTANVSESSTTRQSEVIQTQLPQYVVDFQVKKGSFLSKMSPKYAWRQFVISGQSLEIIDQGQVECSFRVREVKIVHLSSYSYRLKANPWHRLDFFHCNTTLEATITKEMNEAEAAAPSSAPLSSVIVAQVQDHLKEMLAMYEFQSKCSSMEEVHRHLLGMEANYCANQDYLYRYLYLKDKLLKSYRPIKEIYGHCPHPYCSEAISIESMYKFHINGDTVVCSKCSNLINLEVFEIAPFVATCPRYPSTAD
ncbi:hypothetical protein AC1031_002659 [Aphanomyces cochlioides]|nr:hypothetical protein AC1031_002659 [Aphanomyces cochlioides]